LNVTNIQNNGVVWIISEIRVLMKIEQGPKLSRTA